MTRIEKKKRELQHVRLFQRLCADAPRGKSTAPEPPDFRFETARGPLGLELTEYHAPRIGGRRPEQEQDALRNRVVAQALRLFAQTDSRHLSVAVLFRPLGVMDRPSVAPLAAALAAKIHETSTEPWKQVRLEGWRNSLPEPLSTVFITEVGIERPRNWRYVYAASVRPLSPADVQAEILKKEESFNRYPPDLTAAWLLIVVSRENSAAYANLTSEALVWHYQSRFSRVFLLDTSRRHHWEFLVAPR